MSLSAAFATRRVVVLWFISSILNNFHPARRLVSACQHIEKLVVDEEKFSAHLDVTEKPR